VDFVKRRIRRPMRERSIVEAWYLNKSIKIFRFYTIALLVSILINILLRPLREEYSILIETLVALPIFVVLVFAPIGLYYNWKSYKAKEEPRKKRTIFLMGHLFFCTLIILFMMAIVKDLSAIN
jgi:uncharacterized membrane protein